MAYQHFRNVAYQTMIKETNKKTRSWPCIITCKHFDLMIKLHLQKKVEKQYVPKIQSLCRILSFELAIKSIYNTSSTSNPEEIN